MSSSSDLSAPAVALMTGPFGDIERAFALPRPMTIADIVSSQALAFRLPTIAVLAAVDGETHPVLRGAWTTREVACGETLAFIAVPGRGGSDGGGKQILGLVASLALAVAAPFVGGAIAGALNLTGTALKIGTSLASLAFLGGGSLLLNALFPQPSTPDDTTGTVYTANAAGNSATPLDVIDCQYGEERRPWKFASRPYSEFCGNDQYLYQLFCGSVGALDVSKIEFGDTTAWSSAGGYSGVFDGLTIEIVEPGSTITLFPANVVTSDEVGGQELPDPGDVLGPFVVNDAGTTVDRLAVDFAFPAGLYAAGNSGAIKSRSVTLRAQYQQVDDDGSPVGAFADLFHETFTFATRTPQRITRVAEVTPGRYRVKFASETAFSDDNANAYDHVVWAGLRGYLTDFVTPPGCTLLALKIKAGADISQAASNQVFVTSRRKLPVWDGDSWSDPVATGSIAWAAADLLRNTDYGLGLTPAEYDLAALATLDATWTSRGDTFNGTFDRKWTSRDALAAIVRTGRAQPVRLGGRISFVRDEVRGIRRATFTPQNVVRGSFTHKFVLFDDEKPDHVIGQYLDATTWKTREVVASLAGVGSAEPQTIEWFGITGHDQAWRESVTEAAVNAYRREFVGFTAEWEGKLLVRLDPILVLHPFIEGVANAALRNRSGGTLTVDRDLEIIDGAAWVILRDKQGREWGPCQVDSQTDARTVVLDETDLALVEAEHGALDDILPGTRAEPATVVLCEGDARPFNGLVVSAAPSGPNRIDVLAVVDAPEVYLADLTETKPPAWISPTLPAAIPTAPIVTGLFATARVAVAGVEVEAMWQPAAGASSYLAEISYDAGVTWTPIWAGNVNRFTQPILPQPFSLRVAGIGSIRGPWATVTLTSGDVPASLFGAGVIDADALGAALNSLLDQLRASAQASLAAAIDEIRAQIEQLAADNGGAYAVAEKLRNAIISGVGERVGENEARVTVLQQAQADLETALALFFVDLLATTEGGTAEAQFQISAMSTSTLPDGAISAAELAVRAGVGGEIAEAAIRLAAYAADGGGYKSQIQMIADQAYMVDSYGNVLPLNAVAIGGAAREVAIASGEITVDYKTRRKLYRTVVDGDAVYRFPTLPDGFGAGVEYDHDLVMDEAGGHSVTFDDDELFGSAPSINSTALMDNLIRVRIKSISPPRMRVTLEDATPEDPSFAFIAAKLSNRQFTPIGEGGGQAGELMVVIGASSWGNNGSSGASAILSPSGWTPLFNATAVDGGLQIARLAGWMRRLDGSEQSDVAFFGPQLTGGVSGGASYSRVLSLRFAGGTNLVNGSWTTQDGGRGDPTAQTIALNGITTAPVIAFMAATAVMNITGFTDTQINGLSLSGGAGATDFDNSGYTLIDAGISMRQVSFRVKMEVFNANPLGDLTADVGNTTGDGGHPAGFGHLLASGYIKG